MKRTLAGLLAGIATAVVSGGQVPASIDFQRDVQPILRAQCGSCHGPELQMAGLRLDRRADAMRGGSQTVIGPHNAEGSLLYQRVAGRNLGVQMPPTGALSTDQIDIIKQWIDQGAVWPDAAAGEAPRLPADPDATRLVAAIREGDAVAIDAVLRTNAHAATRRGAGGTTPLMTAALYGGGALVKRLMEAGADVNARNDAGATALMWAVPNTDAMQLLLDAGADVNARSDDRRTPLLIASGIVGASRALALLLDYGADPAAMRLGDVSPLREAAKVDDPAMFRLLLDYMGKGGSTGLNPTFVRTVCAKCAAMIGAGGPLPKEPPEPGAGATAPIYDPGRSSRPTPIGATPATPAAIRAAVERSLPLLQDVGVAFVKQTGCFSCHHNSIVSMAVAAARSSGFAVNEEASRGQSRMLADYLETWRDRTIQNISIAGGADTISYLLFGAAADHDAPSPATDAQAILLRRRQAADGHWSLATLRPPIESRDIEVTAVSMRALQAFAPQAHRAEYTQAVDRARGWLMTATPEDNEDRAFRLLGLTWAGARRSAIDSAARDLIAAQERDGGWAQLERMGSDAYATGEALVALRASGAADLTSRAYRRGIEFLLRTQVEDGSWPVESRAVPIQPYFESGFPYGVNQWISAAATGWATTALALAK